jgi:hypothetical protein
MRLTPEITSNRGHTGISCAAFQQHTPQYPVFPKHFLDKTLGRMAFFPWTTNGAFSADISRKDVLEGLDDPDYDSVIIELTDLATTNQDTDLL